MRAPRILTRNPRQPVIVKKIYGGKCDVSACNHTQFKGRCMCLDALWQKIHGTGCSWGWSKDGDWELSSKVKQTNDCDLKADGVTWRTKTTEMFQVDPATPCDPSKNKDIQHDDEHHVLRTKDAWKQGDGAAAWNAYAGTWPGAANHQCCKGLVCRSMRDSVDLTTRERWVGGGLFHLKKAFIDSKTPLCLDPAPPP